MVEGSATVTIARPVEDVFPTVADLTRMGEWSPEATGGRWVAPATGPALGAQFEGDNVAKIGPIVVKKWTTISEITAYQPNERFEFTTAGSTVWRYEFESQDDTTVVTESFSAQPYTGWEKWVYGVLGQRTKAMNKAIHQTLAQLKDHLDP